MNNIQAILENIRIKIRRIYIKKTAKFRKKKINNNNFSIISNNCWGGFVYQSYGFSYNSPTIGLFFMADDYIEFLKELRSNLNKELKFIKPEESKWFKKIKNDKSLGTYPIGKIGDIEIFFLHYKSENEAYEKWNRRKKRVNWNNLIIKFNDQNKCTEKNVIDFYNLKYKNKLFFTVKDWNIKEKYIKINQIFEKNFIRASYEPFGNNKYININKYINNVKEDINGK